MFDEGVSAYLGVASPNFPNFFMLGGPYSLGATHSSLLSAEFQVSGLPSRPSSLVENVTVALKVNYIMSCLTQSCRAGIRSIEVRQDVVRRFTRRMDQVNR